jgi:CDP-paratose 2-epimerase
VHAAYDGNPSYLIHSNLVGAMNCLEHARRHGSAFVFLSSSRKNRCQQNEASPLSGNRSVSSSIAVAKL